MHHRISISTKCIHSSKLLTSVCGNILLKQTQYSLHAIYIMSEYMTHQQINTLTCFSLTVAPKTSL